MPLEERFITFNLKEVYKAISIRCLQEDKDELPKGVLTSIEINGGDNEDQNIVYLHIDQEGETVQLEFDREFFALALVFYCQGSGIPLPKRGQKVLKVLEDRIIMKMSLVD